MTRAEQAYKGWRPHGAYNFDEKNGFISAFNMQQAVIDRLMLEFCPKEMTQEQEEEWEKSQKPAAKPIAKKGWTLVHVKTCQPVNVGDEFPDFRGAMTKVVDGTPPHKPDSTGRIQTFEGAEFFPGVCDLEWVKE